jgi:hypothetical protein
MDVMALHTRQDPFAGTGLSNESDESLSDIWDWCVIQGCRPVTNMGRLYMKMGQWDKFR